MTTTVEDNVTPASVNAAPSVPARTHLHLDDYVPVAGAGIDELRHLAALLRGRRVQMVNSTSVGGGVAELLSRLVPLLEELEVDIHWDVMAGGQDFFEVTKGFHNALHGGAYVPRPKNFRTFLDYTEANLKKMHFDSDFTVIHDPQPAGLIGARAD